ncbi:Rad18p [Malassezia vespertilionis]|uniref:Postreplication repair E3 ubiquitin-protein ligase RAD18 n=1 Tax=Malassezia vespertilionis TaxID=2020962 RepID=A0A2N1JBM0_9BASI|nr:Rad18p [Malassezia vespertilionis]
MQADDFVLFDDPNRDDTHNASQQVPGFGDLGSVKPSFLHHRSDATDTSPLVEEAAPFQFPAYTGADPVLMQRSLMQANSHAFGNVQERGSTLDGTSPTLTSLQHPSSGTLGAPLTMLSLQGDDTARAEHDGPLFPSTGLHGTPPIQNMTRTAEPSASQPSTVLKNDTPKAPPAKDMSLLEGMGSQQGAPFEWAPNSQQGTQNLHHWKQFWNRGGIDDNILHASDPSNHPPPQPNGDKLTVSPRDLYLGYDEHTQRPSKQPGSLFSSKRNADNESALSFTPFATSSAMETGSSTEEEDDEDEKPFPPGAYAGTTIGTNAPNEKLLQQWSRSMYGPSHAALRNPMEDPDSKAWSTIGPSFSQVSTSSESDDEGFDRTIRSTSPARRKYPDNTNHTTPDAMSGYGHIPGSQCSQMSVSTESDSVPGSQMSEGENMIKEGRARSPSILNSAQAIHFPAQRSDQPMHASVERGQTTPPLTSNLERTRQSGGHSRRHEENSGQSLKQNTAEQSALLSSATSEQSSADEDESDYEQTVMQHNASRTTSRRGRPIRTGHRSAGSTSSLQSHINNHLAHGSPTNHHRGSHHHTMSSSSSAIRCDYVNPFTYQACGTIFHRMYDLARHRITLHLREEAQMVKDNVLNVDQCVILGKEVDDIFHAPVAIRECGHLFCSSCIRMHINQAGGAGAFCPNCRQKKAYDSELVSQTALEATAEQWRAARPHVMEKKKALDALVKERDALRAQLEHNVTMSVHGTEKRVAPPAEETRRLRPRTGGMDYRDLTAADAVQCPICAVSFTAAELNAHLDFGCDPSQPPPAPPVPPDPFANAKRLTRPQYQLKSERDLRKMLAVLDLPVHGSKERLIERHRQWVNLYNANLDASAAHRESASKLRRQLSAWDRAQDEAASHHKERLVTNGRQYKTWLNTHRSQYHVLTAQARTSLEKPDDAKALPEPRSPESVHL